MDDLHELAESLLGQPCYIALVSDGVPETAKMPGALAITGLILDVLLRPWLESHNQWHGRRPAIVIDDVWARDIASNAAAQCGDIRDELTSQLCTGALLHELAHVAQKGVDQTEPTSQLDEFAEGVAALSYAAHETAIETGKVLLGTHNATFARLCCHLIWRAKQLGVNVVPQWVFCAGHYNAPDIEICGNALLGEPEALAREPIFEVPTFRPPLPYRQLWENVNHGNT